MHKFTDSYEEQRLIALRGYNLIQTNVDFSYILESLLEICDAPFCSIVAVYENDFHVIESAGFKSETVFKRKGSCTEYVLKRNMFCELSNVKEEKEIEDEGKVFNNFEIVFYAGCPIIDPDGYTLGVLNILDSKTKVLTDKQKYLIEQASYRISSLFIQNRQEHRLVYFNTMFNKSKDIIGIIRFTGEILSVNPAFSDLLGYKEDEIYLNNMLNFIHSDYLGEAKAFLDSIIAGKSENNYTLPLLTIKNTLKWIQWTTTPEDGSELIYFIGRDITEPKEQSVLLKKSEARFRGFFENSQSIMCMHDLQGNISIVNKTAADKIGMPVEFFMGKNLSDFLPAGRKEYLNGYLKSLKESGKAEGNTHVEGKVGTKRVWLYNSIVEENIEGEAYVLGNAVDLTERYKIEEELLVATKTAEEANRAKAEFIANMSHEIRTPLNGIIGFTDLVLKTSLDDTQQQYLKIINQSGSTLLKIVDQILDFSKIESNKIILSEEKIDLQNLASDACAMVSYALEKKGLEMLLDFQNDLPRYIWGDEVRLKQVLVNLLNNSVKFTEKGEIKLSISMGEELHNNEVILHFEVCDTGIGIKANKMDQIFRAFTQEDSSITKKYGGTGLGLSISNSLLELMLSKLNVKSEVGVGSCFSFDIQFKAERDNFDDELLKDIKRILVVDDNDSNRQILKRMLELKNIYVDEADSGLAALLMLQKNAEYDVIIMDYHMPLMDGIETIRKTKEIVRGNTNQPIVMLYSSSDDEKLQSACDELEVQSRLVKPIKMQEMYNVLAQLKAEKNMNDLSDKVRKNVVKEQKKTHDGSFTVLIAEDNEINLYLTKILVSQIAPNSTIVEAKDGVEAVLLFFTEQPDIVFMDIQMPNMNGIEATQAIRKKEKVSTTPIIALTAGNMAGEKEKCLAAGMNDFMVKPLLEQSLIDIFQKWIDNSGRNVSEEIDIDLNTEIEHLNRTWFNQYASDDIEFKGKLVGLARSGIKESAQVLGKAIEKRDLKAINEIGHKLKGTCLAVGFTQLSKYAIAFELLEELDDQYVHSLFVSLLHEIKIVDELLNIE